MKTDAPDAFPYVSELAQNSGELGSGICALRQAAQSDPRGGGVALYKGEARALINALENLSRAVGDQARREKQFHEGYHEAALRNADIINLLESALEEIAESHDAGRHDGLPEPCPAHDAETMFGLARQALALYWEREEGREMEEEREHEERFGR
jgi:hypothetical protein